MQKAKPLIINGWEIFAHSLFLDQIEELITQVETLRRKNPIIYKKKNVVKRLAAIAKLAFSVIPQDPTLNSYRQGTTLGENHKHWFRAKFFQQYRLFFRYHLKSKIIVFVWVNDEGTKRAYRSKTDAYKVFKRMLNNGHPPDSWNQLLKQSKKETFRLNRIFLKDE